MIHGGGMLPVRRVLACARAPDDPCGPSLSEAGRDDPRRAAPLRPPAASLRVFPRSLGTSPLLTLAALFLGHFAGVAMPAGGAPDDPCGAWQCLRAGLPCGRA